MVNGFPPCALRDRCVALVLTRRVGRCQTPTAATNGLTAFRQDTYAGRSLRDEPFRTIAGVTLGRGPFTRRPHTSGVMEYLAAASPPLRYLEGRTFRHPRMVGVSLWRTGHATGTGPQNTCRQTKVSVLATETVGAGGRRPCVRGAGTVRVILPLPACTFYRRVLGVPNTGTAFAPCLF